METSTTERALEVSVVDCMQSMYGINARRHMHTNIVVDDLLLLLALLLLFFLFTYCSERIASKVFLRLFILRFGYSFMYFICFCFWFYRIFIVTVVVFIVDLFSF